MATVPVQETSRKQTSEAVEKRFRQLAERWQNETCFLSSMSEANAHPAYQEIIRLGPEIVPLLLRDMEAKHTHWFAALRAITGANPTPAGIAGNIPKMVEAWLRWAKDQGYQW